MNTRFRDSAVAGSEHAPGEIGAAGDADALAYYATHSPVTDPGPHAELVDALPLDLRGLVAALVGLLLHPVAAAREGIALPPERRAELDLRYVPRMLARLLVLDPRPLAEPRPIERRLIGNCRDSAVLLCAVLRHRGRPARARNGFATYLAPDFLTDHWVCEYWAPHARRWVAVDPGFPPDRASTGFDFDTLDVPADRFLTAGRAWRAYRRSGLDAARCGLPGRRDSGPGWIASQVVRDLAALNKRELLAWDTWALGRSAFEGLTPDDAALLDRVVRVTADTGNEQFPHLRALYQNEARLGVPPAVRTLDHRAAAEPVQTTVALAYADGAKDFAFARD